MRVKVGPTCTISIYKRQILLYLKGKVVLSSPLNNSNVSSAALGIARANYLSTFYASIAIFPDGFIDRLGSLKMFSEVRRRRFNTELKPYTKTWPWLEAIRLLSSKINFSSWLSEKAGDLFSIDAVNVNLDKHVASQLSAACKKGVQAIYSYEDVASFSFRAAKDLSLKCLYDLPIGYWRSAHRILGMEREKLPEWAATLTGLNDSKEKLARKDEELKLADYIFVASSFTANTLQDYPGSLAHIEIIPYGFPNVINEANHHKDLIAKRNSPLKILFVGGLSQRKGIAYLFEAVEKFKNHIELTVVGRKVTSECLALDAALAKHTWIPTLPNAEVIKLMRQHHVLVFPSLFEGFGLVITEAMSQGIPVITTDRTGGADFIKHNENGWMIEAGSTEALQMVIEQIVDHPELIEDISRKAMLTAKSRTWEVYEQEIAQAVINTLK